MGAGEGQWRGARREVHGEDGGEREGRCMGGEGVGKMEGSETGGGRGWGGQMEGSETGGAWVDAAGEGPCFLCDLDFPRVIPLNDLNLGRVVIFQSKDCENDQAEAAGSMCAGCLDQFGFCTPTAE